MKSSISVNALLAGSPAVTLTQMSSGAVAINLEDDDNDIDVSLLLDDLGQVQRLADVLSQLVQDARKE